MLNQIEAIMKKIMIIAALALGFGYAAHAQTTRTTETTTKTVVKKEYTTIDKNSLPVRTIEKIGAKYGGYTIVEAHKAADGEYKLVLRRDGNDKVTYFTKKGEFLRED